MEILRKCGAGVKTEIFCGSFYPWKVNMFNIIDPSMETKSQRFLTFNDDTDLKYCNNVCQYMPQINNDPLSMFIKQRHVLDTVSY